MRKTVFMASAAFGAMTAAERAMGRYMRAPDAHPAPAEPAPAAPELAPPAAPEPEKVTLEAAPTPAKSSDDLYEEEFGGSLDDDSQKGDDQPAKPDPVEPAPEPKDVTEPEKKVEPPAKSVEDRLAAAEAAAEEARREARELRERLEKPQTEQQPQQEEPEGNKRPNPDDYDFGEADSEFIQDLAKWTAEERFKELMADRDQTAKHDADYNDMQSNWNQSISAEGVAEQYPDFQDKVVAGADRGDWHCSQVMTVAIKSSPVAADVAYDLASNAAESKRIAALPPAEQILEIGRIEGKYLYLASQREAAPTPAPTPAPSQVKPSKAPEPPPSRSRGQGGQFNTELDATYDKMLSEFK